MKIHTEGRFTVHVFAPPREHVPPHVHVFVDGDEVEIGLGDEDRAPYVRRIRGKVLDREVREALRIVMDNQERFLEEWRKLHGP